MFSYLFIDLEKCKHQTLSYILKNIIIYCHKSIKIFQWNHRPAKVLN